MDDVDYLIIGAGVTGLAFANFIDSDDYLIIEKDDQPGGYCKSIHESGFVWDYSGHFFHFRNPEIETFLRERMPHDALLRRHRSAAIYYRGTFIDYPFQKNIHQLPWQDFIDCLYHLCSPAAPQNATGFKTMLYERFGQGIAETFLIPYNEKLLAADISLLDPDAMGRFFPSATLRDIISNFKCPDNASYNTTFLYPQRGACQYIEALMTDLDRTKLKCQESLESVDLGARIARTNLREIKFRQLVSSAPFPTMLKCVGAPEAAERLSSSKVLAINLGFDRKGNDRLHWVYFPEPQYPFYRVGYYDNVLQTDRMSLYVESGHRTDAAIDFADVLPKTLQALKEVGLITTQALVAHHHIVMDPAYVHITHESNALYRAYDAEWRSHGVHSIGRYGGWKYCSIEDNILDARALAAAIAPSSPGRGPRRRRGV